MTKTKIDFKKPMCSSRSPQYQEIDLVDEQPVTRWRGKDLDPAQVWMLVSVKDRLAVVNEYGDELEASGELKRLVANVIEEVPEPVKEKKKRGRPAKVQDSGNEDLIHLLLDAQTTAMERTNEISRELLSEVRAARKDQAEQAAKILKSLKDLRLDQLEAFNKNTHPHTPKVVLTRVAADAPIIEGRIENN